MTRSRWSIAGVCALATAVVAVGVVVVRPAKAEDGQKVPLLHVNAVAGAKSGEQFCYPCSRGETTYGVVFIQKWNGMVAAFVDQLEELRKDHEGLGVLVVILDDGEGVIDQIAKDAGKKDLQLVTIGVPDGETGWSDVENWKIDESKQTNAYVVSQREAKSHITAGCPHCDGVAKSLAKQL